MSDNKYVPKVNVVLSISPEEVKHNINTNMQNIPTWFSQLFYPNGYSAYILSAGPSLEKYVEQLNLKERMEDPNRDFVVFCVKHAYPRLVEMGIDPDFCVILDGRPFTENSTHGINRKSLFSKITDRTVFMVASMSNPGYAEHLMINGARVLGWHTDVTGIREYQERGIITAPIISGGTSSGTRCIGIANAMGIKDITLVGFDSCVHNPTPEQLKEKDDKGRNKLQPVDLNLLHPRDFATKEQQAAVTQVEDSFKAQGLVYNATLAKRFYTTGELLAQAQDFEKLFTNASYDLKFTVLDDGIVSHMFSNVPNIVKRGFSFVDHVKNQCPRKTPSKSPKRKVKLKNVSRKRILE